LSMDISRLSVAISPLSVDIRPLYSVHLPPAGKLPVRGVGRHLVPFTIHPYAGLERLGWRWSGSGTGPGVQITSKHSRVTTSPLCTSRQTPRALL